MTEMDLLISFSRHDKFFANVLKKALKRFGYNIWFYLHEAIGETDVEARLRKEISSCNLMLLIITPNSINSNWVNWEIDHAVSEEISSGKLKVLPILMAGSNLPLQLSSRDFLDFRSADLIKGNFYKLLGLLIKTFYQSPNFYSFNFEPNLRKIYDLLLGKNNYAIIKNPIYISGNVYRKRWEDDPPFVELDDNIEKGKIVCVIDVMQMLNQIESDYSGKVINIFIDDGDPVVYDQPLMIIAF